MQDSHIGGIAHHATITMKHTILVSKCCFHRKRRSKDQVFSANVANYVRIFLLFFHIALLRKVKITQLSLHFTDVIVVVNIRL
jgi:hypothetical protein